MLDVLSSRRFGFTKDRCMVAVEKPTLASARPRTHRPPGERKDDNNNRGGRWAA